MNSEFALKCDSISKTYKINSQNNLWGLLFKKAELFTALSNVSLEIKPGEILGMIGKNGAGKSTLLKVLSGITFSTSGTIETRGRIGTLLEVGTGFHPELTGRENIYLNGAILGMSRKEINQKIDEIIDFSEIEKFIDTPVKRYSSGMYTRLAFAVSASLESEILFVDEVLAVGDASFQKKCLGKMGDISSSGRTIIFVSHNMGAIAQLCNRCIYLKGGKIVFDGLPKDSIECYLNDHKSSTTSIFVRKEISDKPIYIDKISLENEKQEKITQLEIFEKSQVIVEYTVKEKSNNVVIAMEITCNGQPILYSYDTDHSDDLINTRKPGHYKAKIELSTPIFKEGDYRIIFKIGHNHINISEENIEIKFSIVNNFLNIDDKAYRKDRPGFLCNTLQWITTKE